MLIGIRGDVILKEPTRVHIETHGLVYEVNVSVNTSSALEDKRVYLHLSRIVREDSDTLYGFYDTNEKKMFDTLLKINGVGPKVALAVCSTFSPATFAKVVSGKDVTMLKKVPGIGPKAASRILVELADFIVDTNEESSVASDNTEAFMALESLGFKKDAITKALKGESGDTATLVKTALKKLQRL